MMCLGQDVSVQRKAPFLALLCGLTVFLQLPTLAIQNVTLGWLQSTDPNIVGYNIYYGSATHNYTNLISVGNVTNTTVTGLVEGVTYYFSATTYDTANQESDFSTEVSYLVPANVSNHPPTLNPPANVTINENSTSQTLNLTGISSGSPSEIQTLTVTAVSSNPALIPNPTVTYTSPNSTGSLTFTPVSNASGSATISVSVNDGGASNNIVTTTFSVTVNPVVVTPVNQPPTLNSPANVTINENSASQTVNLSGISSGSPSEIQTLTVTAVSSNPALIPNPTITYSSPNSTGSLTFTPVSNASGSATISVSVNDGGASNNIVTTTFIVTVNAVNQPPTLNPLGDISLTFNQPATLPTNNAAVNQPPTLNPISDLTINQNAPAQSIALSGISSGSPTETQALTITAVSSNPTLIPNPTVTYTSPGTTGLLVFKPLPNVFGTAAITVTVTDNGSPSRIVTQTFIVTVAGNSILNLGKPVITKLLTATAAVAGQNLAFSVTASGSGTLKYQWKFNGADLTSQTNALLSLNQLTAANSGSYSVVVFNSLGAVNSAQTSLNVSPSLVTSSPLINPAASLSTQATTLTPVGFVNGKFSFNVSGGTNYQCVVQFSTNMVDWVSLQTNSTPFTITDPDSGQFGMRYYRTVGN